MVGAKSRSLFPVLSGGSTWLLYVMIAPFDSYSYCDRPAKGYCSFLAYDNQWLMGHCLQHVIPSELTITVNS